MLADPLVERDIVGSIGLACSTLGSGSFSRGGGGLAGGGQAGLADVTDPDSLVGGNLGLAVFLWEAHFADEDQPDFYIGLFDLNAWYQVVMSK